MAITYDAPTNTITVVGGPYGFNDVYLADVAGGWGVSHRVGTTQFSFDALFIIGDGVTQTTFTDTMKNVCINNNSAVSWTYTIQLKDKVTFTLGTLHDATTKQTGYGVNLLVYYPNGGYLFYGAATSGCILNLYGSHVTSTIYTLYNEQIISGKIYHTIFDSVLFERCNLDVYDLSISTGGYGMYNMYGTSYDTIKFMHVTYYVGLLYDESGYTFRNVIGRGRTGTALRSNGQSLAHSSYFINCDFDFWDITWIGSDLSHIYRQYTFDLKVTDKDNTPISGATVALLDKFGASVFSLSTAADGTIVQQTVSRGYYNQANGNTLQEYSPHTLTISKSGYQTYVKKFTLAAKTNWEIKLAKWSQILLDNGKPVLNLVPTDPENKCIIVL